MNNFHNYKSKINISRYSGKLYVDQKYGMEQASVTINYSVFSNKWDIEEVNEDNMLRIIHRNSGDSILLAFNSLKDRINFTKSIYASKWVNQLGQGMNLEEYANMNLKPREETIVDKLFSRLQPILKTVS